ncbi:MAG: dihydropteroate synthase [Clostridia bacterium]|nr:dihydropteroate synthase [Clostridia bacterium]
MKIGNKVFENYTFVMAIINLTPDSFWENSRHTADDILFAVDRAVNEGAAVIDLGAQSTRPNYTEVSADEELRRLERPLKMIKERFDIPVSVDTYYSKCAAAALSLGADMINDVWGLTRDRDMAKVIADFNASVCIMHNADKPVINLWNSVEEFLKSNARLAEISGVSADKIILDGGIGFAKSREQNFELLNGYERLHALGYPLLLGTSRKSFFGGRVEDRLSKTMESTRLAARKKVLFVRVHDVKENARAIEEEYGRG